MLTNSEPFSVWREFYHKICDNEEVYRVLVTKRQVLDNPKLGFLQYVKSTEESQYSALEINGKKKEEPQKIFEEVVDPSGNSDLIELGDYSFRIFKSSGKDGVHIKQMAQHLRNTFNWFLVLDCEEYQQKDMMKRIGNKFERKQDDIIEPDTLFKIGEKIDCSNIGAIKSPMGQCLLQSTIDFTKRHIKLYQRAALEYITNSKENNYLRILSFNLSNFKKPVFNEERISRTKYNVEITEEAYNPFGEDIVSDNIMNQIQTIVSANADIICLQQASESIEYRESVNDYFSIGASAYLGMIFRNASANKERLSKNQVEELCAYNLGMLAFQYAWRMREIEYLFKKTTLVFLISWLLEAHGQPTKKDDPGEFSVLLEIGNPEDTNKYIPKILKIWESEFENELKLHKLEARELYSYREMILDNSSYLITDRPEIIHAVLEVEKEENGRVNLRNEFLKQNTPLNIYYKKRFTHPTIATDIVVLPSGDADIDIVVLPSGDADIDAEELVATDIELSSIYKRAQMLIEQMANTYVRAPGQYDSVFGKDEFSQDEIKVWDEQKTLYEMAVEARKNRDINRILISTPNRRTLRTVYNNTAYKDNMRIMLKNELEIQRVPRFKKSRTLTNAKFLENYDLEKINIKVKYKIQKIKSNPHDKEVKKLSFDSPKWAQEECYRIINMHNGKRQKGYRTTEQLFTHHRENHDKARDDEHPFRFAHIGIIKVSEGTKTVAEGFRQESDILRPTMWTYRPDKEDQEDQGIKGINPSLFEDILPSKIFKKNIENMWEYSNKKQPIIDTDRIVKKIPKFPNISQPDYTIEFELFKPVWKALILAIGSKESVFTEYDKEVQSDIEKIRTEINVNTRKTLQILYKNVVNHSILNRDDNDNIHNMVVEAQNLSYQGLLPGDDVLWSGIFKETKEQIEEQMKEKREDGVNHRNSHNRISSTIIMDGGNLSPLEEYEPIHYRSELTEEKKEQKRNNYWDWVRKNVMNNFKTRFKDIVPFTAYEINFNTQVLNEYPQIIEKKYNTYLAQILIDPGKQSILQSNSHYLEMFDNILGKFDKTSKINPMLNNIIHRQMYEDTFNDIIDEVAHYTAKLNKRVTDMREYITDYVVSQRNWLKYYLESYGYTRHTTTETGLQLWHKHEIKRDKDTIVKLNFDKDDDAIRIISNEGKNILVGHKTSFKIGSKDDIGTFPMNIINVDMQYFDENDLRKLKDKLNLIDFTLIVGTFPIDHNLDRNQINMTQKMKHFLYNPTSNIDEKIVDTFQHFEQINHEIPIEPNTNKFNKIKFKLPKVTDLLSNSFDPVSNYHYQTYDREASVHVGHKKVAFLEKHGLTLKGSYVLYNTSSRHMGIISDYSIGSKISSAQSIKLAVKEGGKNKLKTVSKKKDIRKHRGIIQIGGKVGKLRKGFKYSGKRLKNGLAQIVKVKTNKN